MVIVSKHRFLIPALVLLSMVMTALPLGAEAYSSGDQWQYDFSGNAQGLILTGTYKTSFNGVVPKTVNGIEYSTNELDSQLSGSITGTYGGYSVTGTLISTEKSYYEVATHDQLLYTSNDSWSLTYHSSTLGTFSLQFWVDNKTSFVPMAGSQDQPNNLNIGDTWIEKHTMYWSETSNSSGIPITITGSMVETGTYEVMSSESITTPAGTFACYLIRSSWPDSTFNTWWSDSVGGEVKISAQWTFGELDTYTLHSFSYTTPTSSLSTIIIVGAAIIVIVAIVSSIIIVRHRSKRRQAKESNTIEQNNKTMPPTPPPQSPPLS